MNDSTDKTAATPRSAMTSQWVQVTQDMINQFGATTLDPDPMHIDPAWATQNSPFGKTIAYGFLTVSLLTHLFHNARKSAGTQPGIRPELVYLNYGFDRLRLVAPVPAGAWMRGHFCLADDSQQTRAGHRISKFDCEIEIQGEAVPALSAEWLTVGVPPRAARDSASPLT